MTTIFLARKGQSLVEAIAAIAMLTLVVTALVGLSVGALRTASISRNRSHAVSYAQEGIEKVRAYRDQNTWAIFTTNCQSSSALGLSSLPSPPFTGWTITCSGSGGTRKVGVSVSWTDSAGDHSVDLNTYFTDWR